MFNEFEWAAVNWPNRAWKVFLTLKVASRPSTAPPKGCPNRETERKQLRDLVVLHRRAVLNCFSLFFSPLLFFFVLYCLLITCIWGFCRSITYQLLLQLNSHFAECFQNILCVFLFRGPRSLQLRAHLRIRVPSQFQLLLWQDLWLQ